MRLEVQEWVAHARVAVAVLREGVLVGAAAEEMVWVPVGPPRAVEVARSVEVDRLLASATMPARGAHRLMLVFCDAGVGEHVSDWRRG